MCKGHPGNREAAVDREINKQRKKERSDGGQSLLIHRVNYRPESHRHTPKAVGSGGSKTFALLCYLCICVSNTCFPCFVIILFLIFQPLCALLPPRVAFHHCFSGPLLLGSLWGLQHRGIRGCSNLFGQRHHFVFANAGCFRLLLFASV